MCCLFYESLDLSAVAQKVLIEKQTSESVNSWTVTIRGYVWCLGLDRLNTPGRRYILVLGWRRIYDLERPLLCLATWKIVALAIVLMIFMWIMFGITTGVSNYWYLWVHVCVHILVYLCVLHISAFCCVYILSSFSFVCAYIHVCSQQYLSCVQRLI